MYIKKKYLDIFLFLTVTAYFITFGKHVILYQNDKYLFLYNIQYFTSFMNMPGGFSLWLVSFLSQFYYYPLVGALIISTILLLIRISVLLLFQKFDLKFDFGVSTIIFFVVLYILMNYENSLLFGIAVLINLIFLNVFFYITNEFIRTILIFIFSFLLYFITGAFYNIFIISAILFELLSVVKKITYINILFLIILSLFIPYILSIHYYYLFAPIAYSFPIIMDYKNYFFEFFIIIFLIFMGYLIILLNFKGLLNIKKIKSSSFYLNCSICVIFIIVSFFKYDKLTNNLILFVQSGKDLALESCYSDSIAYKWDDLLQREKDIETNNTIYSYYTNIALTYKHVLLDDMFKYDQHNGVAGLFYLWEDNKHLHEHGGMFYYLVGCVNEAHHWEYESLVLTGALAYGMQKLTIYNLVLGKYEGAKKYLNVLSQTLFYRDWANRFLYLAEDTSLLNKQEWVMSKRAQIPQIDTLIGNGNFINYLTRFVEINNKNVIALDYVIAYYLLKNNIRPIFKFIPLLKKNHGNIPNSVKEALVLANYKMDNEYLLLKKYDKYLKEKDKLYRHAIKPQKFKEMFGKTYWFYYDFMSPYSDFRNNKNDVSANNK